MKEAETELLRAFSAALRKEKYPLNLKNSEEILRFFRLAKEHKILPLLVNTLEDSDAFPIYKKRARQESFTQAQRSADFQLLYEFLRGKGLSPLVLKGIICRELYSHPEQRPSSDEDLWVDPNDFMRIHEALLEYGLNLLHPEEDINESFEVAYEEKESNLYIEVHKSLFPPTAVYGELNGFFADARNRAVPVRIYGTEFLTISPHDHLLYLILHVYKHFLHSGFGIRQIGDIILFSEHYCSSIDWQIMKQDLQKAGAFDLGRAIYKIGLSLRNDEQLKCNLHDWDIDSIDEAPLLKDVLESGIYGASSFTRLHTSTMTLNAMKKNGRSSIIFSSVFLPLSSMEGKYPFLKKKPYLLPAAWMMRVFTYLKETKKIAYNDPQESIRLGRERIELLKLYRILEK